jgi:Tol biopolymer transport system component
LIIADQEENASPAKLSYLSYQTGEARRITNDLNSYESVSVTADSRTLATVQYVTTEQVWAGPMADPDRIEPIKSGAFYPVWGPNDDIIYEADTPSLKGDVFWVMKPDGSQSRELAVNSGGKNFLPRVTADQRYLIFVSERSGSDHIWRMNVDGTNLKQLTVSPNESLFSPDCSPDGKWVLYTKVGPEKGIWKVPIDGGEPVRLNDADATTPSVSPDRKLVAYSYKRTPGGPSMLAIMPFDGGMNVREINVSVGETRWTPDGRSILFIRSQGGVSNLWSQPITGGPAAQMTHFKTDRIASFNLSRDGRRVALTRHSMRRDVVLIRDVQ